MHYLIDGHNLIAKVPGIDLGDPDDEAQLILLLRRWIAGGQKRQATVYFDGGLPGGRAPHFSGARLEVVFAPDSQPADDLLVRHIRRVKNPPEYTLVSSDREIVAAAEKRRMPVLLSDQFASELEEAPPPPPAPEPGTAEKPLLSEAEVAAWMELFGPEPEIPKRPRRRYRRRPGDQPEVEAPTPEPPPLRDAEELKDSGEALTPEEVAAWLKMFGPEAPRLPKKKGDADKEVAPRKPREKPREPGRPADVLKSSGALLNRDEIEEWLDIFTDPEDKK